MSQKHQFIRKPRKLLSKDRLFHQGDERSKQKSKDTEDKKITNEVSPNKPYNLISNLRFELNNLRQEVSKLSKKQNRQSNLNHQNEIKQEYRSSKEKNHINQYYFDGSKSPSHSPSNIQLNSNYPPVKFKLKTYSSSELQSRITGNLVVGENRKNSQIQQMKIRIEQVEKKNTILVKSNEDLQYKIKEMAERFKEEYQSKIKLISQKQQRDEANNRNSTAKTQEENDVTVIIHRQSVADKEYVEGLMKKIEICQIENQKLKSFLQKSKKYESMFHQKQSQLAQRQKMLQKFRQALQQLKQQKQQLLKEKQSGLFEIKKLNNANKQCNDQLAKNKDRIAAVQTCNKDMEKNTQVYLKNISELRDKLNKVTMELDYKNRIYQQLQLKMRTEAEKKNKTSNNSSKSSSENEPRLDVKQMQQIIQLQQKSIQNQQSDINYLESQLRKMQYLKLVTKNQKEIIEGLNQQIVNTNLESLNKKYKVMYL